ncbi:hypothetical protein [Mucilaginibacter celer]|uniref:PIN domain-containing protein n=1 Tax=Mucilaginibacter celer TaxID=2305508 RepID=A0A494VJ61_9SPHI|nr:hypothetical protein [Mucilaginibacter celer]AYL95007.1 hypothetical protein HYN43_006715 [Mucilaginibacter celer]
MKKDIFIDNNAAIRFTNPPSDAYKELIQWLNTFSGTDDDAYLVISPKILGEYTASLGGSNKNNNMLFIIDKLTREGRLQKFSNNQIKEFHEQHFSNKILRKLSCNQKDRFHIPIILLSDRKMALIEDKAFLNDIINFPGYDVHAASNPDALNYK